jgi:hypothetical protein
MCYSSSRDFGWSIRKHAAKEPEARRESTSDEKTGPRAEAEDLEFLAFLERSGEGEVQRPVAEKV